MKKTLLVAIMSVLAAACSGGGSATPAFGAADAQQIRQRTQDYAAAFNSKDVDKVLSFHPGEAIFMPPNAPIVRGKETIGDFYRRLIAEGATELKMETLDVGGHGPMAYEGGTFSLNRRPSSGASTRDRGKYMFIWRKYNNARQIQYTIWSSDLPEPVRIAPAS
jgi:ketosteroid isomerase-like protein